MVLDENIVDNGVTLEVRDSLGTVVPGTNTIGADTLNFNPTNDLNYAETYSVTVVGTIEDASGNVYSGVTSWNFTTMVAPDTTPPSLSSLTPTDGAINIAETTSVSMTFDENIRDNGASLEVTETIGGTVVAGTSSVSGDTITFIPDNDLNNISNYTVTLQNSVEDLSGNIYTGQTSWSFTTVALLPPYRLDRSNTFFTYTRR